MLGPDVALRIPHRAHSCIRVGFVPLLDAAPLLLAREAGLFEREGVPVDLQLQPGWATVRDKLAHREIDLSHCLAGLLFGARAGVGSLPVDVVTGMLLNTHGNSICLARRLLPLAGPDGSGLGGALRSQRLQAPLVFGVVHLLSSHLLILRSW